MRELLAKRRELLTHGFWLVAFVNLLGQKEAFLKTDYLPNAEENPRKWRRIGEK